MTQIIYIIHIQEFPDGVDPYRYNCYIIENNFCQVRDIYKFNPQ